VRDGGAGLRGGGAARWIGGMVTALAGRIGGFGGGFGGVVACDTTEPDYIWRCNITKMSPTFHCVMHGWQGIMVN
jgi:hypothetical protein